MLAKFAARKVSCITIGRLESNFHLSEESHLSDFDVQAREELQQIALKDHKQFRTVPQIECARRSRNHDVRSFGLGSCIAQLCNNNPMLIYRIAVWRTSLSKDLIDSKFFQRTTVQDLGGKCDHKPIAAVFSDNYIRFYDLNRKHNFRQLLHQNHDDALANNFSCFKEGIAPSTHRPEHVDWLSCDARNPRVSAVFHLVHGKTLLETGNYHTENCLPILSFL